MRPGALGWKAAAFRPPRHGTEAPPVRAPKAGSREVMGGPAAKDLIRDTITRRYSGVTTVGVGRGGRWPWVEARGVARLDKVRGHGPSLLRDFSCCGTTLPYFQRVTGPEFFLRMGHGPAGRGTGP